MITQAGIPSRILAVLDYLENTIVPGINALTPTITALNGRELVLDAQISTTKDLEGYATSVTGAASAALQELVSITGSGILKFAMVQSNTAAASPRIVVTVDGVELIDYTTTRGDFSNNCAIAVGGAGHDENSTSGSGIIGIVYEEVPFRTSLSIEVQNDDTTAQSPNLYYHYVEATWPS